jgi:hypothetical protein
MFQDKDVTRAGLTVEIPSAQDTTAGCMVAENPGLRVWETLSNLHCWLVKPAQKDQDPLHEEHKYENPTCRKEQI